MIGGLFKSSSRVAMIAAAGLLSGGVAAQAADLGGNCCADLEERVAELEATTARKGNSKVSLKISGALATNVIWHNSDALDAARPDKVTLSNDGGNDTESVLTFSGSAKVNADISVGFVMDFGVFAESTADGDGGGRDGPFAIDDLYTWVKSNTLGTLKFGRVDNALDGVHAFGRFGSSQSQVNDEAGEIQYLGTGYVTGANNFDGETDEKPSAIRYESPALFGALQILAHYTHFEDGLSDDGGANAQETDEAWSVALKFAHEFGAFQVKAMAGYEEVDRAGGSGSETWAISGGINHVPTGIYIAAAYGQEEDDAGGVNALDEDGWSVQLGIEQKWNSLGKTNFYAWYSEYENDGTVDAYDTAAAYGIGMTQAIDAAATLLSLGISHYECATELGGCVDDATVVQFGSVVKF